MEVNNTSNIYGVVVFEVLQNAEVYTEESTIFKSNSHDGIGNGVIQIQSCRSGIFKTYSNNHDKSWAPNLTMDKDSTPLKTE